MPEPTMKAKMVVESVVRMKGCEELRMNAVINDCPENKTFSEYTPSANVSIHISNPALIGTFNPGEEYYLDFTKAE